MGRQSQQIWTKEEEEILLQMRRDGYTWPAIGARLGRNRYSVHFHYMLLNETEDQKEARRAKQRARDRKRDRRSPWVKHGAILSIVIPPSVLQERDESLSAPKSLTAWICGDPPPGRSALAQRGAA